MGYFLPFSDFPWSAESGLSCFSSMSHPSVQTNHCHFAVFFWWCSRRGQRLTVHSQSFIFNPELKSWLSIFLKFPSISTQFYSWEKREKEKGEHFGGQFESTWKLQTDLRVRQESRETGGQRCHWQSQIPEAGSMWWVSYVSLFFREGSNFELWPQDTWGKTSFPEWALGCTVSPGSDPVPQLPLTLEVGAMWHPITLNPGSSLPYILELSNSSGGGWDTGHPGLWSV